MKPLAAWLDDLFAGCVPAVVAFRVDAGRKQGLSFGHLSRCLLLARTLQRERGTRAVFLMRDMAEGVDFARTQGVRVTAWTEGLDADQERALVLDSLVAEGAGWLVHDLPYPEVDKELFAACRERGARTLFIDDARFVVPGADVLLNSSILAPARTPRRAGVRMFLGPQWFLWEGDDGVVAAPGPWEKTVLLTFGGSDPTGLTVKAVKSLSALSWPGVGFRVMLGPGFAQAGEMESLIRDRADCEIVRDPPSPLAYFRAADVVVCAGGRTMYELSALGRPFVAVASAAHEVEPVREFVRLGLANAGLETFDGKRLAAELRRILYGED